MVGSAGWSSVSEVRSRRRRCLLWAALAEACLLGVLVVWLADRAEFGSGSLPLVIAALVLTAVGAGSVAMSRQNPWWLRWGIALPLALADGLVGGLMARGILAPQEVADVAVGCVLAGAMVGIWGVATHVARRAVPERDPR